MATEPLKYMAARVSYAKIQKFISWKYCSTSFEASQRSPLWFHPHHHGDSFTNPRHQDKPGWKCTGASKVRITHTSKFYAIIFRLFAAEVPLLWIITTLASKSSSHRWTMLRNGSPIIPRSRRNPIWNCMSYPVALTLKGWSSSWWTLGLFPNQPSYQYVIYTRLVVFIFHMQSLAVSASMKLGK